MKNCQLARVWWGDNGQLGWWLSFKNLTMKLDGLPIHVLPSQICEQIITIYSGNFVIEPPPDCHCRFCPGNEKFKIKITKPIFFFREEKMSLFLRFKKAILLYFFPDLVSLIQDIYGGWEGNGLRDGSYSVQLPTPPDRVSYLCDISHARSQVPLID